MRDERTFQPGRAKLALILLGIVSCTGAATYALAQTGGSSAGSGQPVAAAAGSLSLHVAPATRVVDPGDVTSVTLLIQGGRGRKVHLRVLDGVPNGATASFARTPTRKPRTTLRIAIGSNARLGGHRIRLLARAGTRRAKVAVNIVIRAPKPATSSEPVNFAISGDLSGELSPGLALPLDLVLTNPSTVEATVTGLDVAVTSVDAPLATGTYPCATTDFEASQFSGTYGFTMPPSSTHTLTELGVPEAELPRIGMLDHPVNQNGCKGASLEFQFSGTATEGV